MKHVYSLTQESVNLLKTTLSVLVNRSQITDSPAVNQLAVRLDQASADENGQIAFELEQHEVGFIVAGVDLALHASGVGSLDNASHIFHILDTPAETILTEEEKAMQEEQMKAMAEQLAQQSLQAEVPAEQEVEAPVEAVETVATPE